MDGYLRLMPYGRWAICRAGEHPVDITSGDVIRLQVDGEPSALTTRVEFAWSEGGGRYVSVDGYPMRDGLGVAFARER